MRTIHLLIFTTALFLSFSTTHVMAQKWVGSPASANLLPDGYVVYGIKVVDKNVIWATASDGNAGFPIAPNHLIKILRTTNGGQTWRVLNVTAAMGRISFDIQAFDSTTAWITTQDYGSGLGRGLFKTTDGGQTWVRKLAHVAGGVYLRFLDKNNGVCFNTNRFAYTSNGGDNWTTDSVSFRRNEFTVLFTGTNAVANKGDTVWVGTNAGRIFRSTDKGHSFTPYSTGIPASWAITSLAFKDARNGMIAATDTVDYNYAGMAKTSDGGATWQVVSTLTLPTDFINSPIITAVPSKTNTYILGVEDYATGVAKSYFTVDNGASWSVTAQDVNSHGATEFLSPEVGWVGNGFVDNATDATTMFKWEGSGHLDFLALPPWVRQNTPAMNGLNKMQSVGKNVMWTANASRSNLGLGIDSLHVPQLMRTGDGGKTYKTGQLSATDYYFIEPYDAKTAYQLGGSFSEPTYLFRRTIDSGATWQNMRFQPPTFPAMVHFYDANNGIYLGDPDSLGFYAAYTADGGNTFTRVPQTNLPRPAATEYPWGGDYQILGDNIFMANVDFVTGAWRMMRSKDRGRNWTSGEWFAPEFDHFELRFAFTDANNGMALSGLGASTHKPFYTTDGGATWQESGNLPGLIAYPIDNVPNTPNLMAVFQDTVRGVMFTALTNDLGKTWNTRKDVGQTQLDARYTALGVDPFVNGQLEIVDNNTAWAQFTNFAIYRYDSPTPIVQEKPDLDLTLTADKDGLPLWNYVKFTLTIKNRGISKATGIKANWLPPYKRTDNGGEAFANVGAYSSKGNYNWWTGDWNIGELAAGETATATFHLFVVKNNANVTQSAQITACNEADLDSAPNNMSGTTPKEDDETSFTSLRASTFGEPVPNSTPSVMALKISPNPAKDKAFIVLNDKNDAAWSVEVVNGIGQVVFSKKEQHNGLLELNTEGYKNGLYFVHLTNGTEKRMEKLMVQH